MKLRCENLVKKYGPRTVVKGVSMEVNQGEIVGFLGPNGAGKTTSFYMITGLIVPNNGKIFLDDEEITNLPMFKRAQKGVGYLAQEASVFRHMTVEDNIMSVMEMSKQFTKEERKERLESLLDEFNLHKVRKSKGIQLSGGERRRCEIARPRVLSMPRCSWPMTRKRWWVPSIWITGACITILSAPAGCGAPTVSGISGRISAAPWPNAAGSQKRP